MPFGPKVLQLAGNRQIPFARLGRVREIGKRGGGVGVVLHSAGCRGFDTLPGLSVFQTVFFEGLSGSLPLI